MILGLSCFTDELTFMQILHCRPDYVKMLLFSFYALEIKWEKYNGMTKAKGHFEQNQDNLIILSDIFMELSEIVFRVKVSQILLFIILVFYCLIIKGWWWLVAADFFRLDSPIWINFYAGKQLWFGSYIYMGIHFSLQIPFCLHQKPSHAFIVHAHTLSSFPASTR